LLNLLRDRFFGGEELRLDRVETQRLSHAREAAAMNGQSAKIFQGATVLGGGITLVCGEPVTVGVESTGYALWFHQLMHRLGHALLVGDAAAAG